MVHSTLQGLRMVEEAMGLGPDRPIGERVTRHRAARSIGIWGSELVALTLTPFVLALSEGGDWGWTSLATLGCLAVSVVAGFAFVAVQNRVAVPMPHLAFLRSRVLVGSTVAILIGAGTTNALMYLVSLYFQDQSTLGDPRCRLGSRPCRPRRDWCWSHPSCRATRRGSAAARSSLLDSRSPPAGSRRSAWSTAREVTRPSPFLPRDRRRGRGPATSASTACARPPMVGPAFGVSNMARYIGAAVATALAASI
jgi:hypothetical protein